MAKQRRPGIYFDHTTPGSTVELDFGKLADATLEALAGDAGVPEDFRADAAAELESRGEASEEPPIEADNVLVKSAERRAAAAKPGGASAKEPLIKMSHVEASKNPLVANALRRAARGPTAGGSEPIQSRDR